MVSPENRFTNYHSSDIKVWEQGTKELCESLKALEDKELNQ